MKFFPLCFLVLTLALRAQEHVPVFPDLTGDALLDELDATYSPTNLLTNGPSRDTMFGVIHNFDGTVRGVYTGLEIQLDPTQDPTQDAFAKGFNTEHVFPKSRINSNAADFDLHNLAPTREDVNSSRGSIILRDNPDAETQRWFTQHLTLNAPPNDSLDVFSEWINLVGFEPREDYKGDAARIYFYLAAVWANQIDQAYFEEQRATLCDWHAADPISAREWEISRRIREFQGTHNPFVLDCTLPERTFCPNNPVCAPVGTRNPEVSDVRIFPNPSSGGFWLTFEHAVRETVELRLTDLTGRTVRTERRPAGATRQRWWIGEGLAPGIYLVTVNGVGAKLVVF